MAQTTTTKRRIDIKTGFDCNNRCRFCVQGNKRDTFGSRATGEVKALLEEALKDADSIVFTGGEVTIRPDFFELLAHARALGYKTIQIQSNGRMFASREFCEKCKAMPDEEYRAWLDDDSGWRIKAVVIHPPVDWSNVHCD